MSESEKEMALGRTIQSREAACAEDVQAAVALEDLQIVEYGWDLVCVYGRTHILGVCILGEGTYSSGKGWSQENMKRSDHKAPNVWTLPLYLVFVSYCVEDGWARKGGLSGCCNNLDKSW